MVAWVYRVPVAADIVSGVIDRQRLDRVDLVVGDVDRVPFVVSECLGIIAIKISPEELVQEVVSEFRHESLQGNVNEALFT